ncbi:MAG: 30S ribosomal protein S19e [Candidatus Bathyarchaeia archaeon]
MPTALDVEAGSLIRRVAAYLKENVEEVSPPSWAFTAKTGAVKEHPPADRDWWYVRCASLLRKLYLRSPVGVSRLRKEYGGRSRRGRRLEHSRPGGGSAVREPLQQLQRAGLVETLDKKGRSLSREGRRLLDRLASEMIKKGSPGRGAEHG